MRILLVQDFYPPLFSGGSSVYVHNLASSLAELGHDVHIATLGTRSLPRKEVLNGVTIHRIWSPQHSIPIITGHASLLGKLVSALLFWYNPIVANALQKCISELQPDRIHTHDTLYLSLSALTTVRQSKRTWIHTTHFVHLLRPTGLQWRSGETQPRMGWWRLFLRWTAQRIGSPTIVTGPSHFIVDLHRQYGFFPHSAFQIIPLSSTESLAPTAPANETVKSFLVVSRLSSEKGLDMVLSAWKKISMQNLRLVIVGDGPQKRALASAMRDDPRVTFVGHIHSQKLQTYYQQADVILAPSLAYESFDFAIINAWRNGRVVITTDLGAHHELLQDGGGQLVPPGNSEALGRAIQIYLENPLRWKKDTETAAILGKKYSWSEHLESVLALYKKSVRST